MAESGLASSTNATDSKKGTSEYGYITETMFDAAMISLTESNSYEERDTDDDEYGYNSQKGEEDAKNVTCEEDMSIADEEQLSPTAQSESKNVGIGQKKDPLSLKLVESEDTDEVENPEDTSFINIVKEEHPTAAEIESCEVLEEKMEDNLIIDQSLSIKEEMVDECDISDHQNRSFSEEMESYLLERLEFDDEEEKKCTEQERKTVTSEQAENIIPFPKPSSSSSSFLLEMLKQPVIHSNKANSLAYEKDLPSFANVPSVRESVAGMCRTDNGKMRVTDENGFTTDIEIISESDSDAAAGNGSKSHGIKSVAVNNDDEVTVERCSPTVSREDEKRVDEKPDTSDIDELLQLTVPKDYANCVWSNDSEANEITDVISTSTPCSTKNSDSLNVQNGMNHSSECMIEAVEEDVRSDDPQSLTNSSGNITHASNTIPSDLSNKISSAPEKQRKMHVLCPEAEIDSSQNAHEVPVPHINVVNGDKVKNPKRIRRRVWPQTCQKGKPKGRGMIQIESIRSLASDTRAASNDQLKYLEEKTESCAGAKTAVSTVRKTQPLDSTYIYKSKQMNYAPHLQAAFRNMVLNHVLPPYSPKEIDTKHWNGCFHKCAACGDKYILESSLENHLSRHSAIFTYMCPECCSRLVFYNRCALLQHIIIHGKRPDSIEAAHLSICPLSELGGEASSAAKVFCVECRKEVVSLAPHMEGRDFHKTSLATNCKICNQSLPSKCALNAHERIHKQKPPHVCPECGLVFPVWESLQKHLQEVCRFLNNRKTTYQCMSCSVVYFSTQKLIEHIIGKHFKEIYKCDACSIACFSVESLGVHRKNHTGLPVLELNELQKHVENVYYTCQLCPNQLIRRDSKVLHAITHAKDHTITSSIYQCDDCDKIFSSKELLLEHNHRCQTYTKIHHRESVANQSQQLITSIVASGIPESLEAPTPTVSQNEVSAPTDDSLLSTTLPVGSLPSIFDGNLDVNEIASSKLSVQEKLPGDVETNAVEGKKSVKSDVTKTEAPHTNGFVVETGRHCILCSGILDMGKPSNMNTKSFHANYCRSCWGKLRMKLVNSNGETIQETNKVGIENHLDKIVPEKKDKPCNKKEKPQSDLSEKKHSEHSKINAKNALNKQAKKEIQPGTESYVCKLCKRLISKDCNKAAIKNHFIEEHRDIFLKALQTGQSAAAGTDKKVSYKLPIQKLIVDNPSALLKNSSFPKSVSPKKRKQPVSEAADSMDSENCGGSSSAQSPSKKSRKKSFSMSDTSPLQVGQTLITSEDQMNTPTNLCYKCGFSNSCIETFRDHIVTHKADPNSLQCPVCGMCFIVRPPLEKHLLIHHGIKNVKECLRLNGFDEPEEEICKKTSPETEDILEANQCKVCREKFDNAFLLEKHFRVHGGAFLLANQKAKKL